MICMYNGAKICDGCMKCQMDYPERDEEFGFSLFEDYYDDYYDDDDEGDEEFGYQDECC